MKKITLIILTSFMGWSSIFAQQDAVGGVAKTDTITSIPCVFDYQLSYDDLMFIPDGPNCQGLPTCYNTNVTFTMFSPGETITSAADIRSVCMNAEHSYLGDLQFKLICPDGRAVMIHSQPNGGGLYLGVPIDDAGGCDSATSPRGIGWNYCWSNNPDYSYHDTVSGYLHQNQSMRCDSSNIALHSNFYHPMNSFSSLIGCPLNGTWSLEICDLYGIDDGWIWNWSLNLKNMDTTVTGGVIYFDQNQNCQRDMNEFGLPNRIGMIQPIGTYVTTNASGVWQIDSIPAGDYTIELDTTNQWGSICGTSQSFTVTDGGATIVSCMPLYSANACSFPSVSIHANALRPCFTNQQIFVMAQNLNIATNALDSAFVEVHLDSLIQITGASLPFVTIAPNTYQFFIGTLLPGASQSFNITASVACNVMIGQTLCMSAEITPVLACNHDTVTSPVVYPDGVEPCTLPWDNSSLSVIGWCANDSVHFRVTNSGSPVNGNMQCNSPVRVYVDGELSYFYTIMLAGGESIEYSYFGNGQTWIIQADQHPLHPGNSHPNAHVEACGNLSNWTPGLVNDFPLDDQSPNVDYFCGEATSSYDPNTKVGYPYGVGDMNIIAPNQPLQYSISFQNTGTDTAFTVVLRDTLDVNLNIFSVIPSVASHPYTFKIYGARILEWTFHNILLPDSNTNEQASHGFATFTVAQNPNLTLGSIIYNKANIYFDYNLPITTNETEHTIGFIKTVLPTAINSYTKPKEATLHVFPNPATNELTILAPDEFIGETYTLINFLGQGVEGGKIGQSESKINISGLAKGVYLLKVGNSPQLTFKIIKN